LQAQKNRRAGGFFVFDQQQAKDAAKERIPKTKNPGLATRVFAIDAKQAVGLSRCFKAFSDP
jgi:hypothetical protein